MDMCHILSWTTMWVVLAVWEVGNIEECVHLQVFNISSSYFLQIMKMALMLIARYNFIFTRPRLLCTTKLGAMFRGILFSVIMLQVANHSSVLRYCEPITTDQ